MTALPNPFSSSSEVVMPSVETAAAPQIAPPHDAAATPIDDHRFVLDEQAFMEAIEPLPLFLQAPIAVLEMLAGY